MARALREGRPAIDQDDVRTGLLAVVTLLRTPPSALALD
jgi:hypothetical protein